MFLFSSFYKKYLLKGELWSILTLSSFFCTFGVLSVQTKTTKICVAYVAGLKKCEM